MNRFYLYPAQVIGWCGPGPPARLALHLWRDPAAPTTQLRVIAAHPEPIDVTVYDAMGHVYYQFMAIPNSILPLEHLYWAIGAYAVQACQGAQTTTRLLVRE